jgi:arylsulfatase A-like enzyme
MPSRISMASGMRARIPAKVDANSLGKLIKSGGYETFYGGKVHLSPKLMSLKAGFDEYCKDQRDQLPAACIEFRDQPFFAVASFINPHDICFASNARQPDRRGKPLVDALYAGPGVAGGSTAAIPSQQRHSRAGTGRHQSHHEGQRRHSCQTDSQGFQLPRLAQRPMDLLPLTERVDAQIGRLLDALKSNGLEKNTLVVFTSDHGDMDGSHRLASKNVFYENSAGVPFIMRYKGVIPAGVVDDKHLISNGLDVLPKLCDYAGVPIPEYLLGRTIRPLAEGGIDNARRPYIVAENTTGRMLRSDRYKYCVYVSAPSANPSSI